MTSQSERIARIKACLPCKPCAAPPCCCPGPTAAGIATFQSYEIKELYTKQCLNQAFCSVQQIASYAIDLSGTGYSVGDVVVINGGVPVDSAATFVVWGPTWGPGATLDANITGISLYDYRQFYYRTTPPNPVSLTSYANGTTINSSATLNITWSTVGICNAAGTCSIPGAELPSGRGCGC